MGVFYAKKAMGLIAALNCHILLPFQGKNHSKEMVNSPPTTLSY